MPKYPETHAERLWQEMLQERGEKDLTKPKKFLTSTPKTVENIGGFEPTLQRKYKQLMEDEQRKLEEAWAEKQRQLQTQRSSAANAQIDRVTQQLADAQQKIKIIMSKIKQRQASQAQQLLDDADKQKFQEVKNKLKEAGLTQELAQVEALENMAEGRFSE
jgi:hypothetical protein